VELPPQVTDDWPDDVPIVEAKIEIEATRASCARIKQEPH
jgi:hypothetical protein